MGIGLEHWHPLFGIIGDKEDQKKHKKTVAEYTEIKGGIDSPNTTPPNADLAERKKMWEELKTKAHANLKLLKTGYAPPKGQEDKMWFTDDYIYMANMDIKIYDGYFASSNGQGGKDHFDKNLKATLEHENLRYEYVKALRESKAYKAFTTDAERDAFISKSLKATYKVEENGLWFMIREFGTTQGTQKLLNEQLKQNALESALDKPSQPAGNSVVPGASNLGLLIPDSNTAIAGQTVKMAL